MVFGLGMGLGYWVYFFGVFVHLHWCVAGFPLRIRCIRGFGKSSAPLLLGSTYVLITTLGFVELRTCVVG